MAYDFIEKDFPYYRDSHSYKMAYGYWANYLFERIARLFIHTGTGDDRHGGIDPIHIEKPLLKYGFGVGTKYKGEEVFWKGSLYGVTNYEDRFTHATVSSPKYSGRRTIGKDCFIIDNNSCRNSMCHFVHHYAIMLAHAEVTLVTLLVNARVSSVPTVNNTKEKTLVDQWRNGVFNGKLSTILDSGFLSVKWQDINTRSLTTLQEIWEVRTNILNQFYTDIGVRVTWNKKGNMIADEVGGNDSMLLFNIDDMLDCRKRGDEWHNELFGGNWETRKSDELNYDMSTTTVENNTENGEILN